FFFDPHVAHIPDFSSLAISRKRGHFGECGIWPQHFTETPRSPARPRRDSARRQSVAFFLPAPHHSPSTSETNRRRYLQGVADARPSCARASSRHSSSVAFLSFQIQSHRFFQHPVQDQSRKAPHSISDATMCDGRVSGPSLF